MKKLFILLFSAAFAAKAGAQKIDSIFFHLYTDSLKKGTNNYINVDGKSSDGHWIPLTAKQISLSSTSGRFENNDLILPLEFHEEKVTVYAVLKTDTTIRKQITIYIKTVPDPELPTTIQPITGNKAGKNRKPR